METESELREQLCGMSPSEVLRSGYLRGREVKGSKVDEDWHVDEWIFHLDIDEVEQVLIYAKITWCA